MYITFTYRCPSCGHEEDRFVRRAEMDTQSCDKHDVQLGPMVKLPPATRTHFRFHDKKLKR